MFTAETLVLPPFSAKIIEIVFEFKRNVINGDYILQPIYNSSIILSNCLVNTNNGYAFAFISNVSKCFEIIYRGEDIGEYTSIEDYQTFETNLNLIKEESNTLSVPEVTNYGADNLLDPDDQLTLLKTELGDIKIGKQLIDSEKEFIKNIILEFKDVFAFDGHLGTTDLIEFQIDIDRSKPVHLSPYRVSPQQRADIINQAKQMLEQNIIEESRSPWNSPIILIKKPESKGSGWRFVNDFRKVNELTKQWVYELPLIKDYFRSLSGYQLFCTLDANSGFYQINIREEDRDVTGFIVPGMGSFRYRKMAMGLCTAPQHYQALMDICLGPMKFTTALCYLDDLLIPGYNFENLMERLRLVLIALRNANLTLKPAKCTLAAPSLRFLGHVIDKNGIHVDVRKIEAIAKLPVPNTQKAIRQFLGKAAYYSEFIDKFATIAAPLYELTKEG